MRRNPKDLNRLLAKIEDVHSRATHVHENELPLAARILAGLKSGFRDLFGIDNVEAPTPAINSRKMKM